jgi:hypothetical protein
MLRKKVWLIVISITAIFAISACGSDTASPNSPANEVTAPTADSAPATVLEDKSFTTESFTAAGWKKSKQYDTETVPESTEIWYGFYQQKDIEIRFYPTHELAVSAGVPAAEASIEGAVKRSKGGNLLDFSGGSFTGYADFLIAGNAVLLCQLERTHCDELVANLK